MPPEAEAGGDAGAAPETGALTMDQALAQLDSRDDDPRDEEDAGDAGGQAEAGADGAAGDVDNSEGETRSPDDATEAGAENPDAEGEEGTDAEGAENPLDAPLHWKPEGKAKWAELPREIQAEILAQEAPRETIVAKAKEERTAIEAERDDTRKFAERLGEFLPQAIQTFRNRWGDNPDWVAYAQAHGADAMSIAKAQYEAETGQLRQAAAATVEAEQRSRNAFFTAEHTALATIAPDLADPKEGPARRGEVVKFLQSLGYTPQVLEMISANDMALARDAMLYRRAKAKPSPTPPKPTPATTRPLARGGSAAAGAADPKARQAQQARNRFAQTKSTADAMAYLDSLED